MNINPRSAAMGKVREETANYIASLLFNGDFYTVEFYTVGPARGRASGDDFIPHEVDIDMDFCLDEGAYARVKKKKHPGWRG